MLSLLQPLDAGVYLRKVLLYDGQVLLHCLLELGGGAGKGVSRGGQDGDPTSPHRLLLGPTSASSTLLSLRAPAASCCVVSKCTRTCANCVAGREEKAQGWGGERCPPTHYAPAHTMPLSPTAPPAPHLARAGPAGSPASAQRRAGCWPRGPSAALSRRSGGSGGRGGTRNRGVHISRTMPGLPLGGPPHQLVPCSECRHLARSPCAWQFHSPSPGRSGEGGADVRPPNPAVPTPNFTASARAGPWLSRGPVTPSAPFPPSVPPSPAAGPPLGPAQPRPGR